MISAKWNQKGDMLVTGANDRTVKILDMRTRKQLKNIYELDRGNNFIIFYH